MHIDYVIANVHCNVSVMYITQVLQNVLSNVHFLQCTLEVHPMHFLQCTFNVHWRWSEMH